MTRIIKRLIVAAFALAALGGAAVTASATSSTSTEATPGVSSSPVVMVGLLEHEWN
ncbi:hypothetical protein Afil01_56610 [Actinorhabdospora filicis]|uniref:Uncharacterized protein n=1 Tax=Actinorhabdospora filicis TaxID=1785913 RepID=A0A9W6WBQ3_9ACTN|nr:hypothetical protein [Actinorhabdospora filicis]GLZ80854.1 hypothetical protein Afil01_56610 [Actinorhabdospora filicis]